MSKFFNLQVIMLVHDSREAAKASWAAFVEDPEWPRVRDASIQDGEIIESIESVFMDATDYSMLK